MYIKLSYEPEEKQDQPKVKPDANTERDANKAIKKGLNDGDAPGKWRIVYGISTLNSLQISPTIGSY